MGDQTNQLQPGLDVDGARPGRVGLLGRPLIVGEVLYDVFPDGTERLGGAPFNVAWHLQALGFSPLLITRVGADSLGDRIVEEMSGWGLDTAGVQRDTDRPTGRVRVALEGGEPSFEIAPDQAYDRLDQDIDLEALVGGTVAVVYHGTLISRSERSMAAVQAVRSRSQAPVFLDVNLRSPWWSEAAVRQSLLGARWVKLNLAELGLLTAHPDGGRPEAVAAARRFRDTYALETVVVTMGAEGALLVGEDRVLERRPSVVVERPEDTVGAGDAFSAVLIAGLIAGWHPSACLDRALDLAALMCTVSGAVSRDRDLYRRVLEDWGE